MPREKLGIKCSVAFCNNRRQSYEQNLSFFKYPNDYERRALWMANCGTLYLADKPFMARGYRVCGRHFEDKMFLNTTTKCRLTHNAVPTIFKYDITYGRQENGPNDEPIVLCNDPSMRSFSNDHNYCKDIGTVIEETVDLTNIE